MSTMGAVVTNPYRRQGIHRQVEIKEVLGKVLTQETRTLGSESK